MSFAVVELKYVKKKTFIVPIHWIKNYKRNHPSTQEFYCFISIDLKDDPNFECKYLLKFNGTAGLFKVFVLTVTDSLLDAISYQEQKRVKSVPQKFRQPANTDAELHAENSKRKKKNNMITKAAKESAKTKNMAHLANVFKSVTSPTVQTHNLDYLAATTHSENTQQSRGQESDITTANLTKELPSAASNNFATIVREALETLESDDALNTFEFSEDHVFQLDDYLHLEPNNTNTHTPVHTENNIQQLHNSLHQQQYLNSVNETPSTTTCTSPTNNIPQCFGDTSTTIIEALIPTVFRPPTPTETFTLITPTLPNQLNHGKEVISGDGVNYKDAYLELKKQNADLEERNTSLQKALVAADKALAKSKVPEVPFTKQDGGRLYSEGVFLNATQCKILDGTLDQNKYVNNLALAIFGRETLKNSSVTGTASKKGEAPAKPPLNPLWLQLLYDLTDARTNKSLSKSDINVILNKKISNFNGADQRKLDKIARAARDQIVSKARGDTRNGLGG